MAKQTKYHVGIEIDKLTNSIVNTISGDSFPTDIHPATKVDLKNISKKNNWLLIGQVNYIQLGYIKEPAGVDFVVDSTPLTEADRKKISEIIAYYKATGKKMPQKKSTTKTRLTNKTRKKALT